MWLLFADLLLFVALVVLLAYWKRSGILTEQRFALMLASFWSFSVLIVVLVFAPPTWQNVILGSGLALFQFLVSYFVGMWFYRKFYSDSN